MRTLYAQRRQATAEGLQLILGCHGQIDAQPGGMHLVLRLKTGASDRRLVARMLQEGLYGEALTDWMADGRGAPALLLNFTNVDSSKTAEALARRILKLL
jgi:GntR family transcriptional regulator/MocR family aminotransferase